MNLKKCPRGHFYNSDKFPYCPTCIIETGNDNSSTIQDEVPTENVTPINSFADDSFNRLTVGWLVCLSGINRGLSYPIYPNENHIGRNSNMNIRIKDESTISRADHAIIIYDINNNDFSLIPGNSSNPILLNGNTAKSKTTINDRDLIQLGECQFLFVRLCDTFFNW